MQVGIHRSYEAEAEVEQGNRSHRHGTRVQCGRLEFLLGEVVVVVGKSRCRTAVVVVGDDAAVVRG